MYMYTLTLTTAEIAAIHFIGFRYNWSSALENLGVDVGDNHFAEHVAWELADAFEADTEGGHSPFPMAGPDLCAKLQDFWDSIV